MTHPIPPGTRDILPDEMRELRALQAKLADGLRALRLRRGGDADRRVRRRAGPRAATSAGAPAAHRFFGARRRAAGDARRHDRADRPAGRQPLRRAPSCPLRFFYNARAYRAVRAPARARCGEFFQAGVELVGAGAPDGTVEVDRGPERRARRRRARARRDRARRRALYGQLLEELGVGESERARSLLACSPPATSSASTAELRALGPDATPSASSSPRPGPARRRARSSSGRASSAARRSTARSSAARGDLRGDRRARHRRARPASTSACCATSATTRARSSRSTTRRSATSSAAAGATTS